MSCDRAPVLGRNLRVLGLALPEGTALVEFVRFNVFDFHAVRARGERLWQPARYLAFVLPGGRPEDVRMILIDPKRIELNFYESIPHLLTPVVSSPKEASAVLHNVVAEMERRYERLSIVRARNLPEANRTWGKLKVSSKAFTSRALKAAMKASSRSCAAAISVA